MAAAVLLGATAGVHGYVLDMGSQIVARAGYRTAVVISGYRPGSRTTHGTLSLHASRNAIDLGARGDRLTRLGQAALELAGVPDAHAHTSWSAEPTPRGWEIIFNSDEGGDHYNHLHLGWEGVGVPGGSSGGTSPQAAYGFGELMALWVQQGGARDAAAMAAQVALYESGGRPWAHLKTFREDSRGLWQINIKPNAHPEYAGANLYEPATNARAAIAISRNGREWSQWSTMARARARVATRTPAEKRIPDVVRPGGGGPRGSPGSGTGAPYGSDQGGSLLGGAAGVVGSGAGAVWSELRGVSEWATAFVKLIGFLVDPENWLRAIEFLLGFSFVLLGLAILVKEFSTRDTVAGKAAGGIVRGAERITPTGRLAAYYKTSRRRTGGPSRAARISSDPTPIYSARRRSGPGDSIPF